MKKKKINRRGESEKVSVSFPHEVEAYEYYEFSFMERVLNKAFPYDKVKVAEVGYYDDAYHGIAYINKQCDTFHRIKKDMENSMESWERMMESWERMRRS